MIVGGLLASGLALGVGTASAADPSDSTQLLADGAECTIVQLGDLPVLSGTVSGDDCIGKLLGTKIGSVANSTEGKAELARRAAKADEDPKPSGQPKPSGDVKKEDEPVVTTTTQPAPSKAGGGQALAAGGGAPAPIVAAPAGAAAGPLGTFSPAALGGIAPAGLASNLFGANAYDPGLLFGSPLGGAAAQLFNPQSGSGVTTVSQAQVLSAPGRGYGTPATIGVIILACLIGFAVRHRVITRMKARDLPEDTTPRHAAPEVEQIEDESEARTTVLTR